MAEYERLCCFSDGGSMIEAVCLQKSAESFGFLRFSVHQEHVIDYVWIRGMRPRDPDSTRLMAYALVCKSLRLENALLNPNAGPIELLT
jgi:hypothetical protein